MSRQQGRSPTFKELEEWRKFAGPADPAGVIVPQERELTSTKTETGAKELLDWERGVRVPTEDELQEWARFTGTAVQTPESPTESKAAEKSAVRTSSTPPPATQIKGLKIGSLVPPEPPIAYGNAARNSAQGMIGSVDRKIERRLKSGKLDPERVIDLHGLDRKQAERTLRKFLHDCRSRKIRLVLVVTGKGRHVQGDWHLEEPGVLKRSVPVWLQQAPLSEMVQHFRPAHASHGGGGAYYVYLRQVRGDERR